MSTTTAPAAPAGPPAPGGGLTGMRERVSAFGGDLDCGPRDPRGWRVTALLRLTRRPHHDHRAPGRRPSLMRKGFRLDPGRRSRHRGGRRGRRREGRGVACAPRCVPTSCSWTSACPAVDGIEATRDIVAAGLPSQGADPDHLRPRRLRVRRAARGRQRLPAQGHPARRPGRRDPHHRRRATPSSRRPPPRASSASSPPRRSPGRRTAGPPPGYGRPSPAASRTSSPAWPRACPTARSPPACICPRAP